MSKKNITLAIILLLLTHLFWAGNIFASKIASDHIPPFLLNCMRWFIAAAILTPFVIQSTLKEWPNIVKHFGSICLFGFLGITIYNATLYYAANTSLGINIAVISTLTPLCTFLFAWALYRQHPNTNQVIGFIIGITGVALLIFEANISNLLQLKFTSGDAYMLIAVIAWAIYTVIMPSKKPPIPPLVFLYSTIVVGLIIAVPTTLWEYNQGQRWEAQPQDFWLLTYIGVFPSLLAYLFYNYGVSVIGPSKSVMFSYLLPVFTALISIIWLNEPLKNYHILGQLLVILGFYFSVLRRS